MECKNAMDAALDTLELKDGATILVIYTAMPAAPDPQRGAAWMHVTGKYRGHISSKEQTVLRFDETTGEGMTVRWCVDTKNIMSVGEVSDLTVARAFD